MRLTEKDRAIIRRVTSEMTQGLGQAFIFGSRLNDSAKGGDWDILIRLETPVEDPALLMARIAGGIYWHCQGRKVDVILVAPNLTCKPIHEVAKAEGQAA